MQYVQSPRTDPGDTFKGELIPGTVTEVVVGDGLLPETSRMDTRLAVVAILLCGSIGSDPPVCALRPWRRFPRIVGNKDATKNKLLIIHGI